VLSIAAKKTYSKIADLIINENNTILNMDLDLADKFIYKYFTLKIAIDNDNYKGEPINFIRNLVSILFTDDFMEIVVKYIEKKYSTDIDKNVDLTRHRFDMGTTFLDRHYKIMYKVSSMSRLIIPLVTHYIHNNPEINATSFLMDVFTVLFEVASIGTSNVYSKLFLFVQRAVQRTLYTDAVMWERLRILGVTPEIAIEDTMNKLITNVVPKYSFEQNIMNLNTVVIRKSIMSYTLRKRDPYTLYSLSDNDGQATDDDTIISETEVFDSYNTQRDESIIMFRKYGTPRDVRILQEREGIIITPEEIKFYTDSKRYHEFQKSAICFAFSRYFGGVENIIGGCRKEDWIRLIIILKGMMKNLGLDYLAHFVSATRLHYSYKRMSKYLESLILNDPDYQFIINTKYKSILGLFEKKNFIKNMIISIINNTYTYNTYNYPKNNEFIEKNEEAITKQVLAFFKLLVH
jgi:hypothetical protein